MKHAKWLVCGLALVLALGWVAVLVAEEGAGDEGGLVAPKPEGAEAGKHRPRPGKVEGEGAKKAREGGRGAAMAFDYVGIAKELNLTDEQGQKLAGLILNQQMLMRLQRQKLDDTQKAKVKDLCMAAGKDIYTAADDAARGKAARELQMKIGTELGLQERPARGGEAGKRPKAGAEGAKKHQKGGEGGANAGE